jgi:hypothetical protein
MTDDIINFRLRLCAECDPNGFACAHGKWFPIVANDRGPSLRQKAKNAGRAIGRVVAAAVTGDKISVSKEEKERRLAICRSCEYFTGKSCGLCGCVAKWKTKLSTEHCPDNPPRW